MTDLERSDVIDAETVPYTIRPDGLVTLPTQVYLGSQPFDPDHPGQRRDDRWHKPNGKMWTSSLTRTPTLCDWGNWCHGEGWHWPPTHGALITFHPARIALLNNISDIEKHSVPHDEWSRRWMLDDYDAVWGDGRRLHYQSVWTPGEGRRNRALFLPANAWDAESTVWLNPKIKAWEPLDSKTIDNLANLPHWSDEE